MNKGGVLKIKEQLENNILDREGEQTLKLTSKETLSVPLLKECYK